MYLALLVFGLVFARQRRLRPPSVRLYALFLLPLVVDGFTQLFGWRESTWELRVVTGALFGLGSGWFIYPQLDTWLPRNG
jgi:uncharacterized membrane protein